ncbi:MAG: hypothetical protein HYR86_00785 [Candidatus Rokubacteria bacterium]|nr:hypothetical protein [Candidatus Rokubacteria bacterium]
MVDQEACPYLVPVIADQLWLYPVSFYCTSGERTRVPGRATLAEVCGAPAYTRCPGYVAARAAGPDGLASLGRREEM